MRPELRARRHHHTAFGYAYRTTALGAQRVHGKGLEVKGVPPQSSGAPSPLL